MPLLKQKLNDTQVSELEQFISTKKGSGREICRAQVVLLLNDRTNLKRIKILTGFSRRQAFRIRLTYLTSGLKAIKDKEKGKPKEYLTKKQLKEIVKIVREKKPKEVDDHYQSSNFWTTLILGDFIERNYAVKYKSRTSLYLIFRGAKFTYHKPGRVYEKRSETTVNKWKAENEEKIFRVMEDSNIVVLTEDEMILSTQTTFQKIWLPEGEFPKVEISNIRKNRSVYGFLNIKTGQEHAFKVEKQNMIITTEILKKIRTIYPNQKLLILWDGAGWHRGSITQNFIKDDRNIEALYFPGYTPELNPQEHVWKNGRSHCSHNRFIANIDAATDEFVEYLNSNKFGYSLLGFSAFS